jgi:hypothetical protein
MFSHRRFYPVASNNLFHICAWVSKSVRQLLSFSSCYPWRIEWHTESLRRWCFYFRTLTLRSEYSRSFRLYLWWSVKVFCPPGPFLLCLILASMTWQAFRTCRQLRWSLANVTWRLVDIDFLFTLSWWSELFWFFVSRKTVTCQLVPSCELLSDPVGLISSLIDFSRSSVTLKVVKVSPGERNWRISAFRWWRGASASTGWLPSNRCWKRVIRRGPCRPTGQRLWDFPPTQVRCYVAHNLPVDAMDCWCNYFLLFSVPGGSELRDNFKSRFAF